MNEVIRAAAELQVFCDAAWRSCLIGGLAVQRCGEARETADVDLALLTGFGDEPPFIVPLPRDVHLRTCSAEDLIILKAFADPAKDWVDIDGIVIRQAGRPDWAHVRAQLTPLVELKEAPDILDRLERRRIELDR